MTPASTRVAGAILCVETSCDDTSAAVVEDGRVRSSIVSSQDELHAQFGGVVPEVASRRHTELLPTVVAEALGVADCGWDDIAAVAATVGPGLIGSLLVGLAAAKSFAYARHVPFIPVDHLQGHVAANYALGVEPPFACLVASGGHTLLAVVEEGVRFRVAARTMDDAAGEAFDKGARLLGLGYPGGKQLDQLAARGNAAFAAFPRAAPRGRDFSFSGLKTALLYDLRGRSEAEIEAHRADIAASYQAAIIRQLIDKTLACAQAEGLRRVALAGGVAANSALRRALTERCAAAGYEVFLPPLALCTDNAAMVGLAAAHLPAIAWPEYLALDAYASGAQARAARPPKAGRGRRP
ncbi:MAG TPA: tRNA (adenosine(37)-N6)-threonylcarbamoyltransferase complex transferase subunit TsaD [Thermoleophilia bacterium]|nr:tRNA (adenosine(37)-N6)-threonylcarbamoyltransferase complex transferase subunit TsaD [Thermoleophilia bacterium]